jgi:predicted metal-dependent hydrolase
LDLDTLRVYALSKLKWIRKQQAKFKDQHREAPREFINRESHYYRGKRYLLKVVEVEAAPKVELRHSSLVLYVRPGSTLEKRRSILDEWYRAQLKKAVPDLIDKWEKIINVNVSDFGIKRMKTKWGSCNREAERIWLNLELAKKPSECLEYVVVHEMVHLLERKHNDVFSNYMDEYLPMWRFIKKELNRLPVGHEDWDY